MTVVLTTAGTAHLVELAAGGSLTNDFDALVLGAGNEDPAVGDDLSDVTQRLSVVMRLASGYPKLADTDARNSGAGATTYTWRFERGAGAPFVASNVAVTNYAGGVPTATEPLLIHGKQTIAQRYDERLIVWINARSGETPTVVTATEQALESRVQRVVGFTPRVRAMSGSPNATVVDVSTIRSIVDRGVGVDTLAYVLGSNGLSLTVGQVERFTLTVSRFSGSDNEFVEESVEDLECYESVFEAEHFGDPRWRAEGGYNVAHKWMQPRGSTEGTYRLRYEMELCDSDKRVWTHVVEVR